MSQLLLLGGDVASNAVALSSGVAYADADAACVVAWCWCSLNADACVVNYGGCCL